LTAADQIRINSNCVRWCHMTWCNMKIVFPENRRMFPPIG
jgi:hypothetical protein